MKNTFFCAFLIILLAGCVGVKKQVNQIKALEDCKYTISSVDSVTLAGTNVDDIINKGQVDLTKMPRLALAFLVKNVPLRGKLNLSISNPSNKFAGINQFEYKVLIKNQELASGFVNQKIAVNPNGGSTTVPIQINSNIYGVLADENAMKAITEFFVDAGNDGVGKKEKKGIVTIKIKPTLDWGNKQITYPGYITINKEISSKNLF